MMKRLTRIIGTSDADFSQVLKHSFWAFVFLGLAIGIQFVFDLTLARKFGADGAGIFYLSLSILTVAAMLGRLGFERAVVRFLPPLYVNKKFDQARALLRVINATTLAIATALAVRPTTRSTLRRTVGALGRMTFTDVVITTTAKQRRPRRSRLIERSLKSEKDEHSRAQ
jgi:O-antigen/teichoic acid export membrane protein